jgi:nitric oxide reductase activation protein
MKMLVCFGTILLGLPVLTGGWAQTAGQTLSNGSAPARDQAAVRGEADSTAKAPVSEKQKELLADIDKLVKMSADLEVSVGKSTKDELSLDVVRKAEAVEQLAKSVKERMRAEP